MKKQIKKMVLYTSCTLLILLIVFVGPSTTAVSKKTPINELNTKFEHLKEIVVERGILLDSLKSTTLNDRAR